MNQARNVAIVGLYEWPKRVDPDVSSMQIKARSIKRALDDAGVAMILEYAANYVRYRRDYQ